MARFIPGLDLCERFYHEAVHPVLQAHFPAFAHSAGRLDGGSEVLGYDDLQSMDHDWGPTNLTIFVDEAQLADLEEPIAEALANHLPHSFCGFPTGFGDPGVPDGSRAMHGATAGPVAHNVTVTTVNRFFRGYLGIDPTGQLREVDWLLIPQHRLRTVAAGRIFDDGLGTLGPAREAVRWYPPDLWYYLLACQWGRINQEESFMARCGDSGDELGSRLLAARMVTELMRLCFLIERQYWPYGKWFGTAFAELNCAADLHPIFGAVLDSQTWSEREQHLSAAYLAVAQEHNALGLTEHIEPAVSAFHGRPYQVPHAERFFRALRAQITSEAVKALPEFGAVCQWTDSTDVVDSVGRCRQLAVLYESAGEGQVVPAEPPA